MREFLARNSVAHEFHDVRKVPLDAEQTVALVRRHRRAFAKKGPTLVAIDLATVTDAEIRKHFLGREGTLRAPTVSVGDTIVAGYDEAAFRSLLGG